MDFIDTFLTYTAKLPTPEIFRLWSGIGAIAGVLERRVWTVTAGGSVFPNLYTLLVAPPAIGKSVAIARAREIWVGSRKIYVAPNSVTKAALLDNLAKASRKLVINGGTGLFEYNSLAVASSEFGVLVPSHDTEFLSVLIDIYDNPTEFREDRRVSKSIEIIHPQLNILAGTQPGYLANLLPEEAWSMGFMSRVIMVYAGTGPMMDLFDVPEGDHPLQKSLITLATKMTTLMGRCHFSPEAQVELVRWYKEGLPPIPEHSKLAHYNGRRLLNTLKPSMIAAASRTQSLVIELEDLNRARDWLLHVEQVMPDVFREMTQRSDAQVIQELHFFMWRIWIKEKKPIHESRLIHFLHNRVPSDKILRVVEMAERSSIIMRQAGTAAYTPRAKHEHGME